MTVGASGDYGVTTGTRTVRIPTTGSATLSVATTGDSTDEPDGSVTATLVDGSDYDLGATKTATVAVNDDDLPPVPVVSISRVGAGAVTEGGSASFRIAVTPAPASPITVKVSIGANTFGAGGPSSVTLSGASRTFSVSTVNDQADEPDGSVTVSLVSGGGYTVGSPGSVSFAVLDDDDPPVVTPVVSITAGSGVTEGDSATFTLSAMPSPTSSLAVRVTVSASGDYGAATGTRTVTIPTSGSATLSVATTGDSTDEPDGSVTATLVAGAVYDLSAAKAATVAVADDDDPPPGNSATLTVSVEGAETVSRGEVLEFTILLSEAAQQDVTVSYSLSNNKGMIAGLDYCVPPAGGRPDAARCWDLGLPWDHDYKVGQVTIAEGEDSATLSVWIPAGAQVPGKAWIFVRLTDVEGAKEISSGIAGGEVYE